MSSSNRVRLTYIEEQNYGQTPAGDMAEIDFIKESFTGTPLTEESKKIRSDRQSGGQVNTGLELSGGYEFELSAEASLQHFIKQAMMNDVINAGSASVSSADINSITGKISGSGFITAGIKAKSLCKLSGFTGANNNTIVYVVSLTATEITFVGDGLTTQANGTIQMMPYYNIGVDDVSDTICKEFLDVADANARSVTYKGERVGAMKLDFNFGKIVEGSFSFAGNGYDLPTVPLTDGRTVNPTSDEQPLDAANSFGFMLVNEVNLDICMEGLTIDLNNNLKPKNCIGALAPKGQTPNSAKIEFGTKIHLSLTSWDAFMDSKLTQVPISMAFYTREFSNKGYGVVIDRAQINFPDPNSEGKDEDVVMDVKGVASYSSTTGETMRIYVLS